MAELLGENPDEWIALAGRVPEDLGTIISERPREILELLRTVRGFTSKQLQKLCDYAEQLKDKKG